MSGVDKPFRTGYSPGRTPWINVTYQNSWATVSGRVVGYHKDALGYVHLRGTMAGGTSGTVAFTLPAGFRPGQFSSYVAAGSAANLPTAVNIDSTTGTVTCFYTAGTTTFAVDGIAPFLAEN